MLIVRHKDVLSNSVDPAGLAAGLAADLTHQSLRCRAEMFRENLTVLNTEGSVFV